MGRGRGKGRRQNTRDDADSGEDERIPASKRRGRPQRLIKNEEDEDTEMVDDGAENAKSSVKDAVDEEAAGEDVKKKRNSVAAKEDSDMGVDENGSAEKSSTITDESIKSVGFRQIGSRRKGKPRRAAEVGVECS